MLGTRSRAATGWLPGIILVTLGGCGPETATPPRSEPRRLPPVEVTVTDGTGYRAVLQRHAGKVVLVDFWATW
ncbi:MAG: hypothetical protein GTO03_12595 [Planctomycetales bacterium]|nr:hypothetical protein [Planctomycetales bacterium]